MQRESSPHRSATGPSHCGEQRKSSWLSHGASRAGPLAKLDPALFCMKIPQTATEGHTASFSWKRHQPRRVCHLEDVAGMSPASCSKVHPAEGRSRWSFLFLPALPLPSAASVLMWHAQGMLRDLWDSTALSLQLLAHGTRGHPSEGWFLEAEKLSTSLLGCRWQSQPSRASPSEAQSDHPPVKFLGASLGVGSREWPLEIPLPLFLGASFSLSFPLWMVAAESKGQESKGRTSQQPPATLGAGTPAASSRESTSWSLLTTSQPRTSSPGPVPVPDLLLKPVAPGLPTAGMWKAQSWSLSTPYPSSNGSWEGEWHLSRSNWSLPVAGT
ncbi:uncharacterized protein LOC125617287 [Marmota marmota marmota]|uniref:uncharacterized protein LOC125617287 n=1 Tax=Marmota marmota marmota TaxID=9994 RepID=UPI0020930BBD|nr:uncharacterized protein LOC125617287 [Marmota marmota marmota]XP_048660850.1 uncharacterized protein LOC125617287 [Marmota marmota marmota]